MLPAKIIQIGIGMTMVAFGLHQIAKPRKWFEYLPSWASDVLPVEPKTFMKSHGAMNVGLGVLFISGTHITFVSWTTVGWWASIVPFAAMYDWRDGMRDFSITAAALAVAVSATRNSS